MCCRKQPKDEETREGDDDADVMEKEGTEDEVRNLRRVTENHIRKLNSIRSSAAERWKKVLRRNALLQYLPIYESSFFGVIYLSCPALPSCESIPPSTNQLHPTRSPFAGSAFQPLCLFKVRAAEFRKRISMSFPVGGYCPRNVLKATMYSRYP